MDELTQLAQKLGKEVTGEVATFEGRKVDSREIVWTNTEGFKVEIGARDVAINQEKTLYAWLEYHSKQESPGGFVDCEYYLKLANEDEMFFEWVPDTYNPYFGCRTEYMRWYGEELVFIYHEKHDYYATLISDKKVVSICLDCYLIEVKEEVLAYRIYGRDDEVKRLKLPGLGPLPTIDKEEALRLGLYPDFD